MLGLDGIFYGIGAFGFGCLCILFWILWQNTVRQANECDAVSNFLKEYDGLETPEEKAARFARLFSISANDATLEQKRMDLMKLVAIKVACIGEGLRASIPLRW